MILNSLYFLCQLGKYFENLSKNILDFDKNDELQTIGVYLEHNIIFGIWLTFFSLPNNNSLQKNG